MEFERLIAYYEGDNSNFKRVAAEVIQLADRVEQRLKNLGGSIKIGKIGSSGASVDSEMQKALTDIARMQKANADQRKAAERQLTREVENEYKQQANARIREMRRAADGMVKEIDRVRKEEAKTNKGGNLGSQVFKGSALGSFTGNLVSDAVTTLTSKLSEAGQAWLNYSAKLEQAKIGFTTLTGSAQLAQQHLTDLQNFAKTTPFQFDDLVEASRRLQGVGIQADRVIPIMTAVGNAAAAAGASSEDIKGITVALSQVVAKGKVAAQEVNQFAERGIPIWQALSTATGKSKEELVKLSEAGALSSELLIQALQKVYGENSKFGDAMMKQSRTFSGAMSNITDSLYQSSQKAFQPWFDKISNFSVELANELNSAQNFEEVGVIIGRKVGEGIGIGLTEAVKGLGAMVVHQITNPRDNLATDLLSGVVRGVAKEFGASERTLKGIDIFTDLFKGKSEAEIRAKYIKPLQEVKKNVEEVTKTAKQTPDISKLLQAQKAAEDAKKVAAVIDDLSLQVIFFGQSSQVAATKQKLLSQGVNDFNSNLGKAALSLARQLDQLKQHEEVTKLIDELRFSVQNYGDESEVTATKQKLLAAGITDLASAGAQAALSYANQLDSLKSLEERTEKIKNLREELGKMGADARFEIEFPRATELDKFNRWVRENAQGFRELYPEIAKTRQELEKLEYLKTVRDRDTKVRTFADSIKETIGELTSSETDRFDFEKVLTQFFKPLDLEKIANNAIKPEELAKFINNSILNVRSKLDQIEKDGADLNIAPEQITERKQQELTKWYQQMANELQRFQRSDGKGGVLGVFAVDSSEEEHVDRIIELYNTLIGAKQKLYSQSLSDFRSNGNDIELEAERTKVEMLETLGIKREQLIEAQLELANKEENVRHRQILEDIAFQKKSLETLAQSEAQKLQITKEYNAQVEAENVRHNNALRTNQAVYAADSIRKRLQDFSNQLPSTGTELRDTFSNALEGIGSILSSSLEQWDGSLKGFFKSVGLGFADLMRQITAELIKFMIIKGITSLLTNIFGGGFGGLSGGHSAGTGNIGGGAIDVGAGLHGVSLPARASGGNVLAGQAYLRNERGPEIFIPNVNGYIVNNEESRKMLGGGKGTVVNNYNTVNQTIHAPRGLVPAKSARQAADAAANGLQKFSR